MAPAAQFGFILENIGGGEIVVIAFLALVVLGPERIPDMARGAGRMLHNLRKMTSEWTGDMQDIVNDPAMQPIRELGEFAVRPRQKLAEYALEAEAEERSKVAAEGDGAPPTPLEGSADTGAPADTGADVVTEAAAEPEPPEPVEHADLAATVAPTAPDSDEVAGAATPPPDAPTAPEDR
jgi:sec-independent protein translocase protein TatB